MHLLRILAVALAAAVISSATAPLAYAQELPPIGETDMKGHEYDYVGMLDSCRIWTVRYWGQRFFLTRCPEGAAQSDADTGGRAPVPLQNLPLR